MDGPRPGHLSSHARGLNNETERSGPPFQANLKYDLDGERMTLPDLLRPGLDLVFIGINPSVYSTIQGHYFARKTNRFWPAFSRSILSESARRALGVDRLEPIHDAILLEHGIGFTDVVKRPTARADELDPIEFATGATDLAAKLETFRPRIACFQGMMGYRPFARVHAPALPKPVLGEQPLRIGETRLFVVPSPSPANAHASPALQTEWYDRLAAARE
jgi:TDG/mug DNA glycosylase family protein